MFFSMFLSPLEVAPQEELHPCDACDRPQCVSFRMSPLPLDAIRVGGCPRADWERAGATWQLKNVPWILSSRFWALGLLLSSWVIYLKSRWGEPQMRNHR